MKKLILLLFIILFTQKLFAFDYKNINYENIKNNEKYNQAVNYTNDFINNHPQEKQQVIEFINYYKNNPEKLINLLRSKKNNLNFDLPQIILDNEVKFEVNFNLSSIFFQDKSRPIYPTVYLYGGFDQINIGDTVKITQKEIIFIQMIANIINQFNQISLN